MEAWWFIKHEKRKLHRTRALNILQLLWMERSYFRWVNCNKRTEPIIVIMVAIRWLSVPRLWKLVVCIMWHLRKKKWWKNYWKTDVGLIDITYRTKTSTKTQEDMVLQASLSKRESMTQLFKISYWAGTEFLWGCHKVYGE